MRKITVYLAIVIAAAAIFGCQKSYPPGEQSPETVFNLATEAMVNGNDALAIDLYYKLVDSYPEFKKYRADAVFRLGTLLYKTERFDEAEKKFALFAVKFKNDGRLREVYEKLLCIYMQEFHDEERAQKIRDLYAKKFKESPVLKDIDKTIKVLSDDGSLGSVVLALSTGNIGVIKTQKIVELDKEFFPVRNYILKSVKSPDGKLSVEREKAPGGYYLFLGADGKKMLKVKGSAGGYAPQWSWNSKLIIFTSMDWQRKERRIYAYNVDDNKTHELFKAKGVGPLLCISPDSGKIVFTYLDKLWMMKNNGNEVSLLSKNVNVKNIRMLAWSRGGDSIVYSKKNEKDIYYLCELGRREIEVMQ